MGNLRKSYGVQPTPQKQEKGGPDEKNPRTQPLSRTLNTHRITPNHVPAGGLESKCQVDVLHRK